MKKSILLTCLLFLLNPAWAQLVFEQDTITHDAGLFEEKAEAVFHFINKGPAAVTIRSVKSSCGCTVPTLEKKSYDPGEGGEIRALFTFGARVGTQQKRITVETDEDGGRTYSLNMVTKIPEWLSIEPRILRWKLGDPATPQTARVTAAEPGRIRLDLPVPPLQFFDVSVLPDSTGGYVLTITPKAGAERATEFIRLTATATEGGVSRQRQFGLHCLVR